ncbi:MAG: lysylphosphatidylglycerol synthase domain-containing protein [Nocardioidaceae bacterium]
MATKVRARVHLTRAALALLVMAGGLWLSTTGIAGVHWRDVVAVLGGVTLVQLAVLAGIWALGLGIYSLVLASSLPGLGVHRSLLLNLSGSAVANVLPLGGAIATALNWRMVRRWGHSNSDFVAYSVLTNILDVLTKMLLPFVAVGALLYFSMDVPTLLWVATAACGAVLVTVVAVRLWLVRQDRRRKESGVPVASAETAATSAATSAAAAGPTPAGRGERLRGFLRSQVLESGTRIGALFRAGWPWMVPASVGYVVAQVVLLDFALRDVGLEVSVAAVVAAAAIERLGTIAAITPGATGIAEIGTIAFLIATGLDPAAVVAGVLLYRVFIVVVEIPVGGTLLGGWAMHQRLVAGRRLA